MTDVTIRCPHCQGEIKLNESLAGPLIEKARARFTERLAQERKTIAAEEAKKAREQLRLDLGERDRELAALNERLAERDRKLGEAQQAQADLLRKQRELDDATRELQLSIEKGINSQLMVEREKASKEAFERAHLDVAERDKKIADMQRTIEELRQQSRQGSQQLQGEVQELDLENLLRLRFAEDEIAPVAKGQRGADVIQHVGGRVGKAAGKLVWETKRTKSFQQGWLAKLREDQREANAEIAILVTQVLPDGVESFAYLDEVWVTHPRLMLPLAVALRHSLLEVAKARQAAEGQESKMALAYDYLHGTGFRQRVKAIVDAHMEMRTDLDTERKALIRQWSKREKQLERMLRATMGICGDLDGITGGSIEQIDGLDLKLLAAGTDDEPD